MQNKRLYNQAFDKCQAIEHGGSSYNLSSLLSEVIFEIFKRSLSKNEIDADFVEKDEKIGRNILMITNFLVY